MMAFRARPRRVGARARLPAPSQAQLVCHPRGRATGGSCALLFEPMPGRPMKEYVVVPPALADSAEVDDWVRRSRAYAGQLPAKKPKARKKA